MSPSSINACKSNIAEATGLMGRGSCATTAIRWAFLTGKYTRDSADPRINVPMEQVTSWMNMWAKSTFEMKANISACWAKLYRKMASSSKRWLLVKGPMSAIIATVIEIGWKPIAPNEWVTADGQFACFDAVPGASQYQVQFEFKRILERDLWTHAASAYNGGGLGSGTPHFGPASKAYRDLLKEGLYEEAKALEAIVTNKTWCGHRLLTAGVVDESGAMCTRCGLSIETSFHKYYQCLANDGIDSKHLSTKTALGHSFENAAKRSPQHECKWFRAILPGEAIGEPVGWMPEEMCSAIVKGDFEELLFSTGVAGTDGGGGKDSDARTRVAGSGAVTFDAETNQYASLHARVPGPQTVPRAELWALLLE
jgi:hypothetical protein